MVSGRLSTDSVRSGLRCTPNLVAITTSSRTGRKASPTASSL